MLGREVAATETENKQLAGHISRVLGLVTSFTQAQATSNNEVRRESPASVLSAFRLLPWRRTRRPHWQVRSVLTAQVLALTEHVSALTKQFTLYQLDQRVRQHARESAHNAHAAAAGS